MSNSPVLIKPTHKAIRAYYEELKGYEKQDVSHEGATSTAFQNLLTQLAKTRKWTMVPKLGMKVVGKNIIPDGTIRDSFYLSRGYWEAKDTADDLDVEIEKKKAAGYPLVNIIFEDTQRGVLYQDGREVYRANLTDSKQLATLVNEFFTHQEPNIDGFEAAVDEFKQRVPDLAKGLVEKIQQAHKDNKKFIAAYGDFFTLCKTALNPNISRAAVDEMLVQHLLTERLFRTIFDNPEFTRRNVIAAEVEKVIEALLSKSFNREEYFRALNRFYVAIEEAAKGLTEFSEKQHFLNTVYERFFQGFAVKVADTHGIVYTPQPIVDFMCASVAEVLKKEFGKHLGSPGVFILDPCTGTGNFIVNLMRRIPKRDLPRVYREQLFANEVMLLPYYIAALNIEHAYFELTGGYEAFEGLCFVDTLDLTEAKKGEYTGDLFISKENTARVRRQENTPITVIIGNPPYNVGQLNENDNNKNRKYPVVDPRVRNTYARDSNATNKNALFDAYVKFFRWASDRIGGRDGIVCFVSNNSFVDQIAFDGMRRHLMSDFTSIHHVDLHGNVRKNPKLSGTTHNVFGIQVGVGITVAVRRKSHRKPVLRYFRLPEFWRKEEKLDWLNDKESVVGVRWRRLQPDEQNTWLLAENADTYSGFLPLGTKETKSAKKLDVKAIFKIFSSGIKTNRDDVVYDSDRDKLAARIKQFIEDYNSEVDRYHRPNGRTRGAIDDFVHYEKVKWSETLKANLKRRNYGAYDETNIRTCNYRPFLREYLYWDGLLVERRYRQSQICPDLQDENTLISLTCPGSQKRFYSVATSSLTDIHFAGDTQCFPFYLYDEDTHIRRENITDWALKQFREHYDDRKIAKWDIFYYVYGILHHPGYRTKYADNLKRELPRIPYAPDFWAFSKAGKELSHWHLDYEKTDPYELQYIENKDKPLSYRVDDKMRLSKDKNSLSVNPSLTLAGIPLEAFDYRLGNRSALDWVIDQYQVKTDKRTGVVSDPNRADDPEYIVRLVGQVIRVSIETVRIVKGLPADFGG